MAGGIRFSQVMALLRQVRSGWRLLAVGTVLAALAGVAAALLAPHVYLSRAVIFPKDVAATPDRNALGGGLAAALNPRTGVSHLNRMQVVLRSRALAERVARTEGIMPALYPEFWDAARGQWREGKRPSVNDAVRRAQDALRVKVDAYNLTLTLESRAGDSTLAFRLLQGYLKAFNERTKESLVAEADANRQFLEAQLGRTYDPWTREKIQQMIVREIETGMLLNANAFEMLEAPEVPRLRESPKRRRIVVNFTTVGFFVSLAGLFLLQAFRNWKADELGHGAAGR